MFTSNLALLIERKNKPESERAEDFVLPNPCFKTMISTYILIIEHSCSYSLYIWLFVSLSLYRLWHVHIRSFYNLTLVPEWVTIVTHNRTSPECCDSFGSWSDPHLVHLITLHCYRCKKDIKSLPLTTSSSCPHETIYMKMDYLVQTCPRQCKEPTKVRILRRGWKTIIPDRTILILEVEVIRDLDATCEENVS